MENPGRTGNRVTRRKILRASLIGGAGIASVAALAGCGETQIVEVEKEVVVEKVVTQVVEKIVEVTAVAEMKPELRSANLRFQLWYPTPVPALKNIADLLNQKYPQLKVEVEAPGDYWTKLQTAIAGGAAPDSWWMNNVNVWAWANKGALEDLTPYVKKDMQVGDDLEQTWKTSVDYYGTFKGKFWGLPSMYTTVALTYNEEMVTEAGIPPLREIEKEWTWDDLLEIGLKLTKKDGDETTQFGFHSTNGIETGWLNWVRSAGGDFIDEENRKSIINSPEAREAFQYLADFRLKHGASASPAVLESANTGQLFFSKRLAIVPEGSWRLANNAKNQEFAWDIVEMPSHPRTGMRGGTTNICGMAMNPATEYKDETWEWLKFNLGAEAQNILATTNTLNPVRESSGKLYFDPAVAGGPPNRQALFRAREYTRALPADPYATWGELVKAWVDWERKIFTGELTVEEGLAGMQMQEQELLDSTAP